MQVQTRAFVSTMIPMILWDDIQKPAPAKKLRKILPENGKMYRIEFTTLTGRKRTATAQFKSKSRNLIFSDRWIVAGRATHVEHGANVKILSVAV